MKKYYKFISDEENLDQFIDTLPDTDENSFYYISLMFRDKYTIGEKLMKGNYLVKRQGCRKSEIKKYIKLWEAELGSFTDRKTGLPIANENLVIYFSPSLRSVRSVYKEIQDTISQMMYDNKFKSINSVVYNGMHHAKVVNRIFDIDLDLKEKDSVEVDQIIGIIRDNDIVNLSSVRIIETHGGFHILVDVDQIMKEYEKTWHRKFAELKTKFPDILQDSMMNRYESIPMPGTIQGNKIVKYIKH